VRTPLTDHSRRALPGGGPVPHRKGHGLMGQHSKPAPVREPREYRQGDRTVTMVDARNHKTHLLTLDALSAGRRPDTPYHALCGQTVIPASMTAPDRARCRECVQRTLVIPMQRGHSLVVRPRRRRWWWRR
jgi:hypothetical protein